MATIAQNITAINNAKIALAKNLTTMGQTAASNDSLDNLVGKVLNIESGGVSLNLHCQVDEPEETSGLWIKKDFTPASTVIAASRFFNDPLTDDAWATREPMTTARYSLCAGVVNGIVYVIGGITGGNSNKNEAYSPIGSTVAENALVIDCSVGTNQVDLIDAEGTRLTVPVTSVGVGDAAGLLKKTASAWHNGTAWTDIV